MPPFNVNPGRFDPYKSFKFRVKWDGRVVAGISRVGPLRRVTEVIEHREGASLSTRRKSPGLTRYDSVVLERGLTHDPEFEAWANRVYDFDPAQGAESALKDFRKDIVIELLNEAGQVVMAFTLFRCWVSEYQALPDLDAAANAVAIESIRLEMEGWSRDQSVVEPAEPGATRPGKPGK